MIDDILKIETEDINKDVLMFFLKLFKIEYINKKVDEKIVINTLNLLIELIKNSNS